MAKSFLTVTNADFQTVTIKGLDKLKARLARLSPGLKAGAGQRLAARADTVVERMKSLVVRVTPGAEHGQHLADGIHRGPGRPELGALSVAVISDAVGVGHFGDHKPKAVEYGHLTPGGIHVPAKPYFWPAVRVERQKFKAAMSRQARADIKTFVAGAASDVTSD